ncbi:hypothetical protein L3X38_003490 [Prunus dulcis]|uniref:Uncharacterized protein n=1 Tax=Prunus dulcis TaxID=3755 RepID=A0AAD5F252_PRUDU|nr:hypothetical protein L3X38_003490 [Prunus dulcis]
MMEYESDIKRYNDILQEDLVYIFLDGLDDRLDKARSDVLHMTPFPTVDQAYAYVRREDVRQEVMMGSSAPTGAGLAAKSAPRSGPPTSAGQPHNSSTMAHLQIQSYATAAGVTLPKTIPSSRPKALTDGSAWKIRIFIYARRLLSAKKQ